MASDAPLCSLAGPLQRQGSKIAAHAAGGGNQPLVRRHSWNGPLPEAGQEMPFVLQARHRMAAAALVRFLFEAAICGVWSVRLQHVVVQERARCKV